MTPRPHSAMQSQDSPLSRAPPRASSGNSARVNESIRNGKRRVEIDLLSDDEDDVASPSQRASESARQRSDQSGRMGSSSSGVIHGRQSASSPIEIRTSKAALRSSRPTGLQRRLYTTAPRATFVNVQAAGSGSQRHAQTSPAQRQVPPAQMHADRTPNVQGHPSLNQAGALLSQQPPADDPAFPQDGSSNASRYSSQSLFVNQLQDRPTSAATMQRSFFPPDHDRTMNSPMEQHGLPIPRQAHPAPEYPAGARPGGSFPARVPHPSLARGSDHSFVRPDVGAMSQARRFQEPVRRGHQITGSPPDLQQPSFDTLFRPRATAATGSRPLNGATMMDATSVGWPLSNTGPGAETPMSTHSRVRDGDSLSQSSGSTNYQHDGSNIERRFDESDDDGPVRRYSQFEKQKQKQDELAKHCNQSSPAPSGSAFRPQLSVTQKAQYVATPSQGRSIDPKATGMSIQRRPALQSHKDFVPATQQQERSDNSFAGLRFEHLHNRPMSTGHTVYPSGIQHQERQNQSAKPRYHEKNDTDSSDEQRVKKGIRFSAAEIGHKDDFQHYEHGEDYAFAGDEEHPRTKDKGKQRAWGESFRGSKNQTVSKKPVRLVTPRISAKAIHLLQQPKDPSVPMRFDFFTQMPVEVRRRIYRHLLKANTPIGVMNGWSQVYCGQQLDLHVSILEVSKKHNVDANTVLYGENVFRYILRDDAQMVEFEVGKKNKDERTFPLNKQSDNLRCLELMVEPNRIDLTASLAFYAALEILVKHKATKLHRLTVDLSPRLQQGVPNKKGVSKDWVSQRVWFTKAQGITDMLKQVKAHFVYFDIHLEEDNHSRATSLRTIIDLRPDISDKEVLAELIKQSDQLKASRSIAARRAIARESIEERLEAEAYKKLDMMSTRLEQAVLKGAPHMLQRGWFTELKMKRAQRNTTQGGDKAVENE